MVSQYDNIFKLIYSVHLFYIITAFLVLVIAYVYYYNTILSYINRLKPALAKMVAYAQHSDVGPESSTNVSVLLDTPVFCVNAHVSYALLS